jgi:tetratricopeptide (TPR) repeat protein
MTNAKPPERPPLQLQQLVQSGFDALAAGDKAAAASICREALAQKPDMPRAHYLAALIAIEANQRDVAIRALEATVTLSEHHAIAWARLAELYVSSGRFVKAEEALLNAVRTERGKASTRDLIGKVFRLAGNLEASHQWHQKAVAADATQVPFLINLANSHVFRGEVETARDVLGVALSIEPDNAQLHWLLSRLEKANSTEHIEQLESILARQTEPRAVAYIHYALGKEHEDLGNWSAAFSSWQQGASARRKLVAYDEAAEIELFETLQATFSKSWFDAQQSDCSNAGPIFIVGQPRTGTTLLDRMLDAHPAVNSAGELRHFGFAVREVSGHEEALQFSSALIRASAKVEPSDIGNAYLDNAASLRGDAAHFIDKLPSNYLYLPLIAAAMPNARILHIRRDPMDTCLAIYKQLFADAYLYSYDLKEIARHYLRYRALMDVWRERFSEHFYEIDYENLVTSPEDTLRKVLQFIGLSWNERCLHFHEAGNATATASAAQVREAPHQRSIGHWKNFEQQLQPVAEILRAGGAIS